MSRTEEYKTIITLPRPGLRGHFPMPRTDRAAQFAPFAALNGHSDEINETARLTDNMAELDENKIRDIDRVLQHVAANISSHPTISVVFFRPDKKKSGGAYLHFTGKLKRIDEYKRELVFADSSKIKIDSIFGVWYK